MKRGPYRGRQAEYERARALRGGGLGYRSIAADVGVPWRTVRSWVVDMASDPAVAHAIASRRSRKPTSELLGRERLRLRLIEERGRRCETCGLETWLGDPIPLEMHRLEAGGRYSSANVELLCPNCHALTDSWKRGAASGTLAA